MPRAALPASGQSARNRQLGHQLVLEGLPKSLRHRLAPPQRSQDRRAEIRSDGTAYDTLRSLVSACHGHYEKMRDDIPSIAFLDISHGEARYRLAWRISGNSPDTQRLVGGQAARHSAGARQRCPE